MNILALDISLYTGYAVDTGGEFSFGTQDFHAVSADYAALGRRFNEWVGGLLDAHKVKHLVLERSFNRFAQTTYLLSGLSWEAHRAAERRNIARYEYAPVTIKRFITGSAKAKKPEIMQVIKDRGHAIKTDHEADAVAMLYLHREKMRDR